LAAQRPGQLCPPRVHEHVVVVRVRVHASEPVLAAPAHAPLAQRYVVTVRLRVPVVSQALA
jgi:hypothetical protein